ncbi:hypothetical protein GCM10010413_30350 [Promicromonospora sukumoe]|uniref:ABC-2 family transporter n=1 Tax=Promicromonospora sukumoe TaxID=88382 RepID=A0A7W3J7L6_9MICO|nr:hypothetical protein [Promicromonospora sukumoe]MBA8807787.1 hypothetical protein [Promicromonospora sukumoe]
MTARLCLVELRKLVDTVTGVVLIGVGALLAGVFGGGALIVREGVSFSEVAQLAGVPGGTLVTVMAILLVTAERSHRTTLVTYVVTPRRERVAIAKAVAAAALALLLVVFAVVAAAVIVPVGALVTGVEASWTVEGAELTSWAAGTVVGALSGWALGLAIGNAPTAIVLVLVWPMAAGLLANVPALVPVLPWLDSAAVSGFADGIDPGDLGRFLTGLAAWVAVPAAVGLLRNMRADVR